MNQIKTVKVNIGDSETSVNVCGTIEDNFKTRM